MATYTHNKTRTWKGRHSNAIIRIEKTMQLCRIKNPFVVEIGPGAIAEKYAHLFPEGDEEDRSFMERKMHQAAAIVERRARDDPKSRFVTYETQEIYDMLQRNGGFSRYLVVDNNQKVLDTVKEKGLEGVETLNWDIEKRFITAEGGYLKADIVIAWKVLEYCNRSYEGALSAILKIPREKGIAALTIPENHERDFSGYLRTDLGIYIRKSNVFISRPLDYERIAKISVTGSAGR